VKGQKGTELLQAAGKNQNLLCNKNQAALFLVSLQRKELLYQGQLMEVSL